MILPEGIAIGAFVLSTVGFMYKMTKDVAEIKKQVTNDLQHMVEVEDKKRGRVFDRLDENKKHSDEKYVMKDMCHTLHIQIDRTLEEIKNDVKILINRK